MRSLFQMVWTPAAIRLFSGKAMTNVLQNLSHPALPGLDTFAFTIKIYAVVLSLIGIIASRRKVLHYWRTRHLQKVWGITNGDHVVVVCSELPSPERRQHVEKREFIYNLKYGDIDAYFDVIVTLLRLFPAIKLRVLSSGEAEKTRLDLAQHLILIGGPDYNAFTEKVLGEKVTQISYRCPDGERSPAYPDEIVIYDTNTGQEFCEFTEDKDYGYFERIKNPRDPKRNVILIGGCHTIGVTSVAKAFSMAQCENGEIPSVVLRNAQLVAKSIRSDSEFVVVMKGELFGQTIHTPIVEEGNITFK
jgi:hypothetical protein